MATPSYPARRPSRKQTTQQQLAAAIDRAQAANVKVAGSGTLANNKPFWIVPSQSKALEGLHHVVTQVGKSLQCDCYAAQRGRVCVHRAAVYLYLTGKAKEAVQTARTVATAPVASSRPAPTAPQAQVDVWEDEPPTRMEIDPPRGWPRTPSDDQPDDTTDMDYYAAYASFYR